MKKFKVKSYDSAFGIDVVVEADIVKYEDNGLIVFKKTLTDSPTAIFDIGRVWVREQE
jgi:hypothetical protein